MEIKVSLKRRIKQFFCSHKRQIGISCATKGINSKEGHWYLEYHCGNCGFSFGEWIEADRKKVEEIFDKKDHKIN